MLVVLALQGSKAAAAVKKKRCFLFQFFEIFRLDPRRFLIGLNRLQTFSAVGLKISEVLGYVLVPHHTLPCKESEKRKGTQIIRIRSQKPFRAVNHFGLIVGGLI